MDQGPGSQTWCPLSGKVNSICQWIVRVFRVLGAPIGTQEYVMRQFKAKSTEHAVLSDSRCRNRPSILVFAHLPWFDPCELQFEDGHLKDGQTTAGAAVCGETTRTLGSVCHGQLAPQMMPIEQSGTQHIRFRVEVRVWEVYSEPKPHIGRVRRIVSI